MRQALGEYDDRDDGFGLVGEERVEEAQPRDRRFPMILLTVFVMALFAGGLWFAYVQGTHHPTIATAARGDAVPLIRADERPTKMRPDQPGGMTIPDQNVSLYNEKAGGPPVEKLLPAPEQPMPRPAPGAKEPPVPAGANPAAPAAAASGPPAGSAPVAATSQPPAPRPTRTAAKAPVPAMPAKPAPAPPTPATASGKDAPVQVRLGSVQSPEAAREEWARLKRENPDLLGKLTAVAVRTDLGDRGTSYRIQAGSFGDAAAAERLCNELKRRNLGCILVR
jgi:SPOR domain